VTPLRAPHYLPAVTKFAPDRFPPGFFDLPAGAGETLPLAVIEQWTRSAHTREAALAILAPHAHRGCAVSSDGAGLTRMGRERPLVEILAMLNRPKEIIHAAGTQLGGRAVGRWVADNTAMVYPADARAADLVAMLRGVQARLAAERAVGTGFGLHRGTFYELGGGLYGPDADRLETVAEEHTEGGEIVVSGEVAAELDGAGFTLARRTDVPADLGAVWRVTGGPVADLPPGGDERYPAPFDDAFLETLHRVSRADDAAPGPAPAYQECAVVLVERERDEPDDPEVALLNDLALAAASTRLAAPLLARHGGAEIKTSGLLAVFTFPECRPAAEFAQAFRAAFAAQGVQTRIGIDVGQTLQFELGTGAREIAGSPVNVASKLAQDCGEFGTIHMSDAATARARMERASRTVTFDVSGVSLTARRL